MALIKIEKDFDEITEKYSDLYESEVCRERQLPDYRDGMRIVQRRIFWVFLTMARDKRFKFMKSASIVGDAMKLHAHGDCLHGSTLVLQLDGKMRTIEDIYKSGEKSVWVLSYDIKNKKYVPTQAHSFRVGQYSTRNIKITLNDGSVYIVTDNHPFLTDDDKWVQAKDLKVNMELKASVNEFQKYSVFKTLKHTSMHELVYYNNQNNIKKKNYVIHHLDHNPINNTPDNLKQVSRAEHPLLHNDYLVGLELGRKSMFSPNGKHREKIRQKNIKLAKKIGKEYGLYRALTTIKYLIDSNIELTEENYNIRRVNEYNGILLPTLKKYGINTFNDLIALYYERNAKKEAKKLKKKKEATSPKKQRKNFKFQNHDNITLKALSKLIKYCHKHNFELTDKNYASCKIKQEPHNGVGNTYDKIIELFGTLDNAIKSIPPNFLNYITNIEIIESDKEIPMYDFTVDNYENMLICNETSKNKFSCIVAHNSSLYQTLVKEVNSIANLLTGKGNWGCKTSSIKSEPAAMRYTECKMNKNNESYFKYAHLSNQVVGEIGLMEAEYIPVPFPYALIANFLGISKAGLCVIPSYKMQDLYSRLMYVLGKGRKKVIKPYYGHQLNVEGEFENILTNGKGNVIVYPNLDIDEKNKTLTIKEISPTITNLGSILESMSVDKTYGRYIKIKDLSSNKNQIIVSYNTKYMKDVKVDFKQLVNFVKKKLTAKITYNIIAYKGYKNYPVVGVDQWLLDNFNNLLSFRKMELDQSILILENKILLFEAILLIRPIIQRYLNSYKKFTNAIIEKMKKEMLKLLNDDNELLSKIMQISITRLLDVDINTSQLKAEIKKLKLLNTTDKHSDYILNWLSELKS